MRNRLVIGLATVLVTAACQREQEPVPAAAPAAPERVPPAAPAQELPAQDSGAPAAVPPPNATAPGSQQTEPSPAATGGRAAGAGGHPAATGPQRPAVPPTGEPAAPPAAAPQPAPSQDDGAAVLQRASAAYENVRSLRADFVMLYSNPLLRQQTTSRGTLYQRRPDRIALRFTDPAGDVILSDGQFYWIYYPSVDAQQVIRCPATEGGEQGVDLQAQFVGDPVQRFRYTLHGQESVAGRPANVLTLEPRERTDYRRLKVWLDTRDSLARRFEITEHNNTVRRFELADLAVNVNIPEATFRFTPPPNARIVSCS